MATMRSSTTTKPLDDMPVEWLCINTIRTLAMDAVERADSGHPGTPMALAPLAYVLWTEFLRYNPRNPGWVDRDRFVLSNGHASMLLYAVLFLTGYGLTLDDLRSFRQWDSATPGHPEHERTPGVETTTGPLGQGLLNSVGMAIAEAHLAAVFNRPGHDIVDHHTYVTCSDGDLMEGASHEAASVAGHLGLGKLIWIYDDNHISIAGQTSLAYSDDVAKRFEGYHWHVQNLGEEARNLEALSGAVARAKAETGRPSLISVRSHIGFGAPGKQDTAAAHGSPLGTEEVRKAKEAYGWPADAEFLVPERALAHMRRAVERGRQLEHAWDRKLAAYAQEHPKLARAFRGALAGELPGDWDADVSHFQPADGPLATRKAGGAVLNEIAGRVPWLFGGSADLAPSTKTLVRDEGDFEKDHYASRNLRWGVREHVMCGASSGMALHGGIRPYAATFFIFTDYARPAIRLAALMKVPVIYVLTHDSIGLGEDGPTHQPVEHLASFRAMPNLCVIRPADANETAYAWRAALRRTEGPTMLVLTRQKLPIFDRRSVASAEGLLRGGYVLSREKGDRADAVLIGTGSEVRLALAAQEELAGRRIDARVVSLPSWELFRAQPREYRDGVLPPDVTARLAIEAGSPFGWKEWTGDGGAVIGMTRFGASAPGAVNFEKLGFTVGHIVERVGELLEEREEANA
jgi:transketolase